jgi:hypothetical protein
MGLLGTVVVTAALALGGGAHARPAHPIVFGTEASNKRFAEVQAEQELSSVRVPPSARPVAEAPAPVLEEALGIRGEPNLVQRWRWLVAPGTVSGALAWFKAHPPAGARVGATTYRGSGGIESASSIWFEIVVHSRRVEGPSVIPIVAPLGGHKVGIRLEVQQVWKTPHPAAAKVPAAAHFLVVSRRIGGGKPKWQLVRSAPRVRRIAHVIDQLPAPQPQILYGCGAGSTVRRVAVRLLFRAHKGGPVLAEASQRMPPEFCESMLFTVRGDSRTFGLDGGGRVLALLHH